MVLAIVEAALKIQEQRPELRGRQSRPPDRYEPERERSKRSRPKQAVDPDLEGRPGRVRVELDDGQVVWISQELRAEGDIEDQDEDEMPLWDLRNRSAPATAVRPQATVRHTSASPATAARPPRPPQTTPAVGSGAGPSWVPSRSRPSPGASGSTPVPLRSPAATSGADAGGAGGPNTTGQQPSMVHMVPLVSPGQAMPTISPLVPVGMPMTSPPAAPAVNVPIISASAMVPTLAPAGIPAAAVVHPLATASPSGTATATPISIHNSTPAACPAIVAMPEATSLTASPASACLEHQPSLEVPEAMTAVPAQPPVIPAFELATNGVDVQPVSTGLAVVGQQSSPLSNLAPLTDTLDSADEMQAPAAGRTAAGSSAHLPEDIMIHDMPAAPAPQQHQQHAEGSPLVHSHQFQELPASVTFSIHQQHHQQQHLQHQQHPAAGSSGAGQGPGPGFLSAWQQEMQSLGQAQKGRSSSTSVVPLDPSLPPVQALNTPVPLPLELQAIDTVAGPVQVLQQQSTPAAVDDSGTSAAQTAAQEPVLAGPAAGEVPDEQGMAPAGQQLQPAIAAPGQSSQQQVQAGWQTQYTPDDVIEGR